MLYDIDKNSVLFEVATGSDIKNINELSKEEMKKLLLNLIEKNGELESQNEDLEYTVEELKDTKEAYEDLIRENRGWV